MINYLRAWLARSVTFSFNPVLRDRFVADQARLIPAGKRVLDVGAGSCPYRPLFTHCVYLTQDAKPLEGVQLRHGAYGGIDYISDATAIPVPSTSFDVVLCTEMIEHHPHPIEVVREFGRILVSGGRLILTAPLGSGIHQEPYHFYGGYTPYWYQKFLAEAGFGSIEVVTNGAGPRMFAQESIRFAREWSPFRSGLPLALRLIWAPFWLLALPVHALMTPVAARLLDQHDASAKFTVGYHVTATRLPD